MTRNATANKAIEISEGGSAISGQRWAKGIRKIQDELTVKVLEIGGGTHPFRLMQQVEKGEERERKGEERGRERRKGGPSSLTDIHNMIPDVRHHKERAL